MREALRPRFDWRPYVFRSYFDTQLLIAEARGKIAHDFRVFFMGHKGTIEAKYTTNKAILPDGLTDEMREAFKRSEQFLDLEVGEDPLLKKKDHAKGNRFGYSRAARQDARDVPANGHRQYLEPSQQQRVVASEEAEKMMTENGWRFIGVLPSGKVVIEIRCPNPV